MSATPNPQPGRRRTKRALTGNNLSPGDGEAAPRTGLYADPNYATNLCTNPSFGTSTAGWSATDSGTALSLSQVVNLHGPNALQVTTSGTVPGQGAIGPHAAFPLAPGNGSMTASVFGQSGTVEVSFVRANGGVALASQAVTLNGSGWQTVVFNNVAWQPGDTLYALFLTVGTEAITFYVDGVMYQPESPAASYVDGDQPNCFWNGTAELSSSYQPYQYPISGTLQIYLSGSITLIATGATVKITNVPVLSFFVDPQPGAVATAGTIAGALTDFGIWTLTDPDPAQTYGWWTNAGTLSSQTGYNQIYGMVVPPLDYQVSGGQYAWRRAAFAAVGFSWAGVPTATEQILTDVQLEYARTRVGAATTPSGYQRARQLQVIIKPSRLNYATNPAFQIGTAGWSQVGSTVSMQVRTDVWPANIATYDNLPFGAFQSCLVTLNSGADSGIQLSVPQLIPGQTYMASCYVMTTSGGLSDILANCGNGTADVAGLVEPQFGYGNSGYGQGPYGGVLAGGSMPTGTWTRLAFPFTAATDTATFQVAATLAGSGAVNPEPFFNSNGSTWTGFNGTFSVTSTPPAGAPFQFAGVYVNNGISPGAMEENASGGTFAAAPLTQYQVSAWVYSSTTNLQLGFDWQTSGHTYISTTTAFFTVPVNTWTLVSTTQTSAGTAAFGYPRVGTGAANGATIYAQAVTVTVPVYPQSFFVTALLIEPGDILEPYFDGNSGPDAMWEYSGGTTAPQPQGGTLPGQSRSYFYRQLQFGQSIVNQTLQSNTPLGISYAAPLYATPPTQ